jgi:hypothetical protein
MIYIPLIEEPWLAVRFGDAYREYCQTSRDWSAPSPVVPERRCEGKELSMKVFCAVLLFGGLLGAVPVSAAQHNIIISDGLAGDADTLRVMKGAQWGGRIAKWRFGDYAVVSSKMGPTTSRGKGNQLRTETESRSTTRSTEEFSFVLTNRTTDSARVKVAHNSTVHTLHKPTSNGWAIASDEVVLDSASGTAVITINGDTTDTWTLRIGVTIGPTTEGNHRAVLTNGERTILLSPVSSNTHGRSDVRGTAAGYEFFENGQSLCALQYFGGTLGNTTIVWMRRSLDATTKLMLAAAMTAVLQMKSPQGGP